MDKLQQYISIRGNLSDLARALGITPSAVKQWRRVPAERVLEVERETGIPRNKLRPDVFGEGEQ